MEKPYRVICVTPNLIQLEVTDIDRFAADEKKQFKIGSYLKITDNNKVSIIATVQSFKIKDPTDKSENSKPGIGRLFVVDAQPVGFLDANNKFKRGGQQITIPPTEVEVAGQDILELFYIQDEKVAELTLGTMALNDNIQVPIDGDRFFSKHIAVVGSTGSGKSCAVAKILQEGIKAGTNRKPSGALNNSHSIIFDIHGEYANAFPEANILDFQKLALPYWLMNSEELEEMFVESNEQNYHNQISQFRHAVIENKKKYNNFNKLTYDTPVYFNIKEVFNFVSNINEEMLAKGRNDGDNYGKPKLKDGTYISNTDAEYFEKILTFASSDRTDAAKTSAGPFNGEFDRFLRRLETKLTDERLAFILNPSKNDGSEYKTDDIENILKQLIGYENISNKTKSNITIVDLAGIPFEETSMVVSLISRILFEFSFFFKRNQPNTKHGTKTEVPILVVYEEAHKYVPNNNLTKFRSVKTAIERIAKEGRKYGISLMIVSQRPSEISETIFSQCNNFIAMRLTNPADQNYVRRLLPDTISNITENLPSLERQEAIIIGDAITIPTLVKINNIEQKPKSIDIDVLTEWQKDWYDFEFRLIIENLQRKKITPERETA